MVRWRKNQISLKAEGELSHYDCPVRPHREHGARDWAAVGGHLIFSIAPHCFEIDALVCGICWPVVGRFNGVRMKVRGEVFFNFFAKHPDAERHELQHENGNCSTIAIGLFQGLVDEGFVGVYDANGDSLSEERPSEDALAKSVGKTRIGFADAFELLKSLAVRRAGSKMRRHSLRQF